MSVCQQTENQTILQHGLSVRDHTLQIINILKNNQQFSNYKIPEWAFKYRGNILNSLLPWNIIEEYTIFHDCGKPYCISIDANGKIHFSNHAEVSAATWLSITGNEQVAKLMRMDMLIHTIKADDINEFITHPEAITFLIVGLAEIHSNAKAFGGINSTSFKIKWNQINRRGKKIVNLLYNK